MDFHSLTRKELQSLCKLNKIPANITNVAMADALQSLESVKGIEEFMNVSKPETADLVETMEKVEAPSPKAPTTRCRTSTRQKVKIIEPENLQPAAAKSTRQGNKQSAGEVEESKNEMLKTPAISTTRRKAPATLSCRNVNRQLNECESEAKEEGKLQKPYSTRRSSRLTEKKSTEPRVKKESEKAVKMDSFVDEVNITSEEVNATPEITVISGNPDAEVEEICDAFEKLDVVIGNEEANHKSGEEKQDLGELNQELTKIASHPCEDEMVVEEGDVNSVVEEVVEEAKEDFGEIDILKKESTNETSNPCEDEMVVEEGDVNSVLEEVVDEAREDCGEIDILKKESTNETSNPCEDAMVVEEGDANSVLEEVVDEAKEDCDEIDILKKESTNDTSNPCEQDFGNTTSNPCEDEMVVEEGDVNSVLEAVVDEAKEDGGAIDNLKKESTNDTSIPCEKGEEYDAKPESDGISSPFEFQIVEQKFNLQEAVSGNISIAVNENSDSNDISSPFQDQNLEQKIDLEDKTFDASEAENSSTVLNQEKHSDVLLDNASLESGAEDSIGSTELAHKDENFEHTFDLEDKILDVSEGNKLSAVKEHNQILKSNGSSIDMVIDNTDTPSVMEEVPENKVDVIPAVDVKPDELFTENINEKTDENSGEITNVPDEKDELRVFPAAPCVFKKATPLKNMSIVSDDKENIDSGRKLQIGFVDEGKKSKKEEKTEIAKLTNLNEISIRQLKKQLKLLTLKNVDAKKEGATTRPALQALCENQLVGGEPKN